MGYLFFDIETYVDPKDRDSGLNPFRNNSKVLAIAYNYYNSFILVERDIIPPSILKEWELGEKEMLEEFYSFWSNALERDRHLKIVGFNQIKFDISYIFARMSLHAIRSNNELFDVLYKRPHFIDLSQISMILARKMSERKEFYNVNQQEANAFFNISQKKQAGTVSSKYYDEKNFDGIINYIKEEFTFESLYIHLRRHIHQKATYLKDD